MNNQADGAAELREMRARFASADQMQNAVSELSISGFNRADLSLPSTEVLEGKETPEAGTKPASTGDDAQQARTLGASTAAAAVAIAAAGITVATGGAAVPAFVAAVLAGGVAGGSVFAIQGSSDVAEQKDRDARAATGDLVLTVWATTEPKRLKAEAILRAAGAITIDVVS